MQPVITGAAANIAHTHIFLSRALSGLIHPLQMEHLVFQSVLNKVAKYNTETSDQTMNRETPGSMKQDAKDGQKKREKD